jgi:hypothetical protein
MTIQELLDTDLEALSGAELYALLQALEAEQRTQPQVSQVPLGKWSNESTVEKFNSLVLVVRAKLRSSNYQHPTGV